MKRNNGSQGFSLIELLISMALSLLLLAMILRIYSWQMTINDQIQDVIYLQDNRRLAMSVLIDAIRSADSVELLDSHEIKINDNLFFYVKNNGLCKGKKCDEIVQGIKDITFQKINRDNKVVGVQLVMQLQAPHGLTATWPMTVALRKFGNHNNANLY